MAAINYVAPYHYGDPNRQFTPLPNSLHNTMNQLLQKRMLTFPPISLLDPNQPLPPSF